MTLIDFLNRKTDDSSTVCGSPNTLFKYRPFDQHAFKMLEGEYVFLCQAAKLDDPSECKVTVTAENLYDLEKDFLTHECVNQILELIRPYTTSEVFEECKQLVYSCMVPGGRMHNRFLIEMSLKIQELAPNQSISSDLINWLANIPERINSPEMKPQILALISKGLNAREETGICSLAQTADNEKMWANYADGFKGYCIEYDFSSYSHRDKLYPVVYEDTRQTNLIMQVVATFVGQMVFSMSNHEIDADRSQFLRLFVAKDTKWAYQREWRLIGEADSHLPAPPIRKIIIGQRAAKINREKMIAFCNEHGIDYEERRE